MSLWLYCCYYYYSLRVVHNSVSWWSFTGVWVTTSHLKSPCYIMTVYMDLGVCSWWPCVLWQAVTLWLVNRGMAVRRGRPVEQVCNRKETTWYENNTVRFRQNPVRIEGHARDTQPIRGVSVVSGDTALQGGCKRWHPLAPGRRYGTRSRLSDFMYLHLPLKLTTNCVPLSRIKWERYSFY